MLGSRNLESCMLIQNNACASDPRQEPGAVAPLAGICAGGGPQGPFLPRTPIYSSEHTSEIFEVWQRDDDSSQTS